MTGEERLFRLLEDLEAQASVAFGLDREAELADRRRAEYGQVPLGGRLMASVGCEVTLEVAGVGPLTGVLHRVAVDWLLLGVPGGEWLVREEALTAVHGSSERAVPPVAWPATARLGLGSALRRLADAGERCLLAGTDGSRREGALARVGADFVELAASRGRVVLVPFATLAAVQSRG